jgi:hypothetical protein
LIGNAFNCITLIASAMHIVARVEVGPNPVHIYGVQSTKEVWTHPDEGGDFYVISLANISSLNSTRVPVSAPMHMLQTYAWFTNCP